MFWCFLGFCFVSFFLLPFGSVYNFILLLFVSSTLKAKAFFRYDGVVVSHTYLFILSLTFCFKTTKLFLGWFSIKLKILHA